MLKEEGNNIEVHVCLYLVDFKLLYYVSLQDRSGKFKMKVIVA